MFIDRMFQLALAMESPEPAVLRANVAVGLADTF